MREIAFDTETTGLDPFSGDRIVEIGAIELVNYVPTGQTYHAYINPERDMPEEAFRVHGLSTAFLRDKPVFRDVVVAFLDFIGDANLVIHNAEFDMKFLNAELGWVERPVLPARRAVDTLDIARGRFPGANNTLDGLCRRFGVDNSRRDKHGALLDARILAAVYLELMGGRQSGFTLKLVSGTGLNRGAEDDWTAPPRPEPLAARLTEAERAAHEAFVAELGEDALWARP